MSGRAKIVIAGAGALGSVIALRLARAGFETTAVDPAPLGENASGVAAGMLAPAFESLFDEATHGRYALLAAARDLWPPLATEIGLELAREGALALGPRDAAAQWAALLAAMGAEARLVSPSKTRALSGLKGGAWSVFAPGDWRLEARRALRLLKGAGERAGARFAAGRVTGFSEGLVALADAPPLPADLLVLATGFAPLAAIAPELAALAPVKGHILKAAGAFAPAPVVRSAGAYLCRSAQGALLGATMEAGVADPAVEAAVASRLLEAAAELTAGLGPLSWRAEAGVRAAAADGLPLVGESRAEGVIVAAGARRNGWLLAPLVAQVVLERIEGRRQGEAARLFDPARFGEARPRRVRL